MHANRVVPHPERAAEPGQRCRAAPVARGLAAYRLPADVDGLGQVGGVAKALASAAQAFWSDR